MADYPEPFEWQDTPYEFKFNIGDDVECLAFDGYSGIITDRGAGNFYWVATSFGRRLVPESKLKKVTDDD